MMRQRSWKVLILAFSLLLLCSRVQAQATITSISPTSGPVGIPVTITGTGFGASQGSSAVSLNGTNAVAASWSDTTIVAIVPTGASSGTFTVTVNGQPANSSAFTLTALPSGWSHQDIGSVGLAGSASYANGAFTITGAGHGIFSYTTDGIHFAYQTLSGDGTVVARVVSASNTYAQTGVMVRETLDASAKSMFVGDYANQIYTVYRTSANGTPGSTNSGGSGLPYWVKLVRSGSSFTGYKSLDGANWAQVGTTQTINMAQTVYVGLATSSGSTGVLYAGTIDGLSINWTGSPAPVITSVSATTGSVGSQVVISGSNFGVTQGSGVVLLNGAFATTSSWSGTSITITIPTGANSGPLVVSVAPGMNDSNPVKFTVTATPLPAGWLDQDVGLVSAAGNASYANGVFTVQTTSTGFDATCGQSGPIPDAFHFVYQPLSGDGTIIARLVGTTSAQAGVMIRETMDASAKSVLVENYSGGVYAKYRSVGGASVSCINPQTSGPWLKLVRIGNNFDAYQSPNGIDWAPVGGALPISMAQTVYIGLAVGGGFVNNPYTANLDNVSVTSATLTPPVVTGLSATSGSIGSQVVISGSGFGASQASSGVLLNDAPVTINSWSDTSITVTIPTGATSGLMSVLLGPSMTSSNAVVFTVTAQPLLSGWFDQDIGNVGKTGSATYANGVFTVQGAGGYLGLNPDAFHFVYQPMSTNGTITARVTGGDAGGQARVVIRTSLNSDAANVSAGSNLTSPTTTSMYYRPLQGMFELPVSGSTQSVTLPYSIQVVRNVNQFSVYATTSNGWTLLGTQTLTTPQTVYVGFGVASNNYSYTKTATFDNVSVTLGGAVANPVITGVSPIAGRPGVSVTVSGSGFGPTQGTSLLNFNGATAAISSWSDTQIVAIVPDAATTGPVMVTVGNITYTGPMFSVAFNAQLTDSLGNQTSYVSSLQGGQWSVTNAQGSGCSSCTTRGTIENLYDANGNVVSTTDAMGKTTTNQYDSSNNLTSQTVPLNATSTATNSYYYNSLGEVLMATNPLNFTTTNTYDSHGNLLTVTTPSPGAGVTGSVTTFTYDIKGELLTVKDPLNNVTTLTYNPVGLIATITDAQNHVTTYGYDAHGNRTSVTDALSNVATFAYDTGDRLTTITYPDSTTTTFGYDYRGRRTSVTDQNGKTTTYGYDDADRLTSVTDAAGNVTRYVYDTENNLTSITDANNNVTTFAYDAFGRVTQTTFPSGSVESYAYDADNNLIAKTDRMGHSISYTYDLGNRLTGKSYPDSTSVAYTYDKASQLTQVVDPTGTYTFSFDNMGRLISTTTSYSFLTGRNFATSYAYDKASNRTGFTDPESGSTTYVYDTLNRLQTLTPPSAFTTGSFGFSYDALSRRTQMTQPNNVTTSYTYDNLSRLLNVLHQLSGSTIDGATYTVDNAGNRISKTDWQAGVTSNYGYDQIYQLLSAAQGANTTETYTYDPVGNRLSSLGVPLYNYNSSNELTSNSNASYGYDYNGNAVTKNDSAGITIYAWDFENRLTSVTLPGSGGTVSFSYDPFGRRIRKVSATGTSIFAYDGDNLVEETNSTGAVAARYSQGLNIDEPLAMLRSATTSYYHVDGLGSVTSLSNGAGSLTQTYGYDSFGKQLSSSGSLTNAFQYTAREFDSESSLYYMRARYFDPGTGRFISEDPITFAGGHNFYAYVGNAPISFTDPFGLAKVCNVPPVGPNSKLPTPITTCASEPLISCLVQTESHGNPKAKSKKGATGLTQMTDMGVKELAKHGFDTANMTNLQLGTTYINLLLTYCSNVSTALAAYNIGWPTVNKAGGIPNATETQNYVKKINGCLEKSGLKQGVNDPGATGGCGCQ